jgi:hypothetical protein
MANIAADLTAWTRLLGFHGDPGLREASPDTLRIWHIPARLARHARQRLVLAWSEPARIRAHRAPPDAVAPAANRYHTRDQASKQSVIAPGEP